MFSRLRAPTARVACAGWLASAGSILAPFAAASFTATDGRLWLWHEMHLVLFANAGPAGCRRSRARSTAASVVRGLATLVGSDARRAIGTAPAPRSTRLASVSPNLNAQSSAVLPLSSRV